VHCFNFNIWVFLFKQEVALFLMIKLEAVQATVSAVEKALKMVSDHLAKR